MLGINYKDFGAGERAALSSGHSAIPSTGSASDPNGFVQAIEWGVYGVPETFIVDADGVILHKHIGADHARARLRGFLAQVEAAKRSDTASRLSTRSKSPKPYPQT